MTPRRVGILFGMERQFPPALVERINAEGRGEVVAEPLRVGIVRLEDLPRYDLILDRISHEVPFYRTYLKVAAARGTVVVNNPFWWSVDDKFLGNVIAVEAGVAVPRTVLIPHKDQPPNTRSESYTNLEYPLGWEAMFDYLGFPIFLKPAFGGGCRDVYRADDPAAFFAAYHQTRDVLMIAQQAIGFTEYYRCYVLGRERVRLMPYDPSAPFERRYARAPAEILTEGRERLERDCVALCRALGYDFNTLEFAMQDGVPYAIDFMNPAPDCDRFSVGDENFEWVLANAAELLISRALSPPPLELTGDWPARAARRAGWEVVTPQEIATSPGAAGAEGQEVSASARSRRATASKRPARRPARRARRAGASRAAATRKRAALGKARRAGADESSDGGPPGRAPQPESGTGAVETPQAAGGGEAPPAELPATPPRPAAPAPQGRGAAGERGPGAGQPREEGQP